MSITRNPSVPELTDFDYTEKDVSDDTEKENKDKIEECDINENNKNTDFQSGIKSIFSNFMIQNSPNIAVKCNNEEKVNKNLLDSLYFKTSKDECVTNLMDKNTKNEIQSLNSKNKNKLFNLEKNVSVGFLSKSLSSFSFLSSFTSNNQESDNNEVNKKFCNNDNDNNNDSNNNEEDKIKNNNDNNDDDINMNNRFGSWTDLGNEYVHDSTYSLHSLNSDIVTIDNDDNQNKKSNDKCENSNSNSDDEDRSEDKGRENKDGNNENDCNKNTNDNINSNGSNIMNDKCNSYSNNSNNEIKDSMNDNTVHTTQHKIDANYISFDDISEFKSKSNINSQNESSKEENEIVEKNKMKNENLKISDMKSENVEVKNIINKDNEIKIMINTNNNTCKFIDRKSYRKAVLKMLPNLKILDDGRITEKVSFIIFFFCFYQL